MTILREIGMNVTGGILEKAGEFKIIYVTSMKALAQEAVSNFPNDLVV